MLIITMDAYEQYNIHALYLHTNSKNLKCFLRCSINKFYSFIQLYI